MNTPEITVKRREGTGKGVARRLRRAGAVPAILYGGATPQTITVNPREGVRIVNDPGQAVATVSPPMAEEVAPTPEVAAAVTPAEPEVLTERKPKEEGAPAEAEGKKAPVAAAAKKPEAPKKAEKEK